MTKALVGLSLFVGLISFSTPLPVAAQQIAASTSVTGYEFMQLTVYEGRRSYLTFAPEFKGQKIVDLSEVYLDNLYPEKNRLRLRTLEEATMSWLSQLSAAGWELVQIEPLPITPITALEAALLTRYLMRKPRG